MNTAVSALNTNRVILDTSRKRCVRSEAAVSTIPPFKVQPNCAAHDTAQAVMAAIANSTCAPYMDLATENTLILNPPWSHNPRAQGMEDAECGMLTTTEYSGSDVHVLAGQMQADGSGFLLWERNASYTLDGRQHFEDVCGCSYIQMDQGEATIIATFRQPTPEERIEFFKPESELAVLPGKDNFFRGRATNGASATPGHSTPSTASMLRAVRTFYGAWSIGKAEACLSEVASKQLHVLEPIWQELGEYLPVNRVEAAMWIERQAKKAGGLDYELKVLSRAEETNLVFALWVATGPQQPEVTGVHIFSFDEDGKIDSVAAFREPFRRERTAHLRAASPQPVS